MSGADPGSAALAGAAGAADGHHATAEQRSAQRLAQLVFAVLVLACFAAFGLTQRLKHSPAAIQNFEQTPAFYPAHAPAAACRGRVATALVGTSKRIEYVSFKPAQTSPVTVSVVNAAGGEEATLVRGLPVKRYKQLSLCWNGQRGPSQRGGLAPAGEYRLRVSVHGRELPVYSPSEFALRRGHP